jgi:hypothetical protein
MAPSTALIALHAMPGQPNYNDRPIINNVCMPGTGRQTCLTLPSYPTSTCLPVFDLTLYYLTLIITLYLLPAVRMRLAPSSAP